MLEIIKVTGKKLAKQFVKFPFELYKGNEYWVPALESDEYETFDAKKNGAFDYCEAERFLAVRDGKVVGRVAAIINHAANEIWKEKIVRFGWLDFIEDKDVLEALLKAVEDWGRERGCHSIKGPWGFTDMDKEGLLVEGFDKIAPFTCLYNYPYYDTLLQQIGFEKDVDWVQRIAIHNGEMPRAYLLADKIAERCNIRLVTGLSMREIGKRYGMKLFHMYNEAFAPLEEFAPLNDRQIQSLLDTFVPLLDSRFVAICVNENDDIVAFAICVPSLGKAIKKSNGRLFPFGIFRILHALKHNDTLEALMIGAHPDYQRSGATVLLLRYIHENMLEAGIQRMVLNPQLEHNSKVQNIWTHFNTEPYMRRRAYRKSL